MDKVQKVGEKNGLIFLVMFSPAVTLIKMSKIAHFLYFFYLGVLENVIVYWVLREH